jgi:long-chain acyl-CoA synthetase
MTNNEPRTINELFRRAVSRRASRVVMRFKLNKEWHDITGAQLGERVDRLAAGLRAVGLKVGETVALLAESCPEWSITDYAILDCGGVTVPIYPTQSVEQVGFILRDCEAGTLFVSNHKQLRRIEPALIASGRKNSLRIVLFEDSPDTRVMSIRSLENLGREHPTGTSTAIDADDVATIIYTSGTTGDPKGVVLTHRNLVFDALETGHAIGPGEQDIALSFLPLSHVFERTVLYIFMHFGIQVCFARGVETVGEDIREIRPTIVTAVPRLFEKVYSQIARKAAASAPWQQRIFHRAMKVGRAYAQLRNDGKPVPARMKIEYALADRLVFRKWREAVGGRIRYFFSGGAALPSDLAYAFSGAGILILQGYGLTETSPVVAVNRPERNRIGTVGQPINGVKVSVAEDGELLVQGDNVMQGYFHLPDETAQVLTKGEDGIWFHTGDIGTIDSEGFIRITDRKKDLIKTSLGKYITPQPIENQIRSIPLVEQAVVIGNERKFPSVLIVPNFEALRTYASSLGLTQKDRKELLRQPGILEFYKKKVDEVTRNLAPHEKIKKIALLDREFSIDSGELTPTLKVRRKFVEDKYRETIDHLYPRMDGDID